MPNSNYVGTSYEEAEKFLGGKQSKKIAHNTTMHVLPSGSIAIKYHYTDIIEYSPAGTVTLNSGGYRTTTTKERLNQWTRHSVSQKNFVWSIRPFRNNDGISIPFEDGQVIWNLY